MIKDRLFRMIQNNWELYCLLLICLLAFAIRYHFLVTYHYPMMIHEQDAVGYMDVAKKILLLQPLNMGGRPPGYPVVIALFALLPVKLEYAARLASIFMDAMVTLPLFVLARIYLSRFPAFAVCLLWVFFSFSLCFSPSPLSQTSFLCYLLTGIVFLHNGLEQNDGHWLFGAGVLFAFSFLTRPEGIVGFVCGLLLCILPLLKRGRCNKSAIATPIIFLLGFLILSGPYLIAFHEQMGYWGITAKTEAALKTQDGVLILNSKGELEKTKAGVSVWKDYYGTLPVFIGAVLANIKSYFKVFYSTFPLWMHLASLAGMITLLWGKRAKTFPFILILLAVTAPNYIVNVSKTHSYLYSVFPAMFICFVACFENFAKWVKWIINKYWSIMNPAFFEAAVAIILLLVVSYISFGFYQDADANYQSPGLVEQAMMSEKIFKEAGEIISNNSMKNDVIMTRWGLVGYFADRPVVTLPKGGVKEVVDYGKKNGARFLLIDTMSVLSRRQELLELLEPLNGKAVNPEYGIEIFNRNYYPDVGGYVIYRYVLQRS